MKKLEAIMTFGKWQMVQRFGKFKVINCSVLYALCSMLYALCSMLYVLCFISFSVIKAWNI
jgi:hypothetical protein